MEQVWYYLTTVIGGHPQITSIEASSDQEAIQQARSEMRRLADRPQLPIFIRAVEHDDMKDEVSMYTFVSGLIVGSLIKG